jgi:hypothetical protein
MKRVHKPAMIRSLTRRLGRSFAAAIQDEKLIANQNRFGDHASKPAGLRHPDQNDGQMKQESEEVAHRNRSKARPGLQYRRIWNSPWNATSETHFHSLRQAAGPRILE